MASLYPCASQISLSRPSDDPNQFVTGPLAGSLGMQGSCDQKRVICAEAENSKYGLSCRSIGLLVWEEMS